VSGSISPCNSLQPFGHSLQGILVMVTVIAIEIPVIAINLIIIIFFFIIMRCYISRVRGGRDQVGGVMHREISG
jgi:hypothetical protein